MSVIRANEMTGSDRAAVRRLTTSLRDLLRAVARADVLAEVWHDVADRVDELTVRLGPPTRTGGVRPARDAASEARIRQEVLPTGVYQAFALPLDLTFAADGRSARGEWTGDVLLEGPLGMMHGGIVAWAFDVIFGCLVQAQGQGALTRSLDVRYRRPTPLGVPLVLEAYVVEAADRTTSVAGTLTHDGMVTASATGDFVVPAR